MIFKNKKVSYNAESHMPTLYYASRTLGAAPQFKIDLFVAVCRTSCSC